MLPGMFERLAEITYGDRLYSIKIKEIEIKSLCCVMIDIDTVERYGFAARSARLLKEWESFILTKRGNLICGELPNLPIIPVKVVMEKNLDFLADLRLKKRFRNGDAIASVEVPTVYPKQEDNKNLSYGTFELVFKGPPVEME